MKGFGLVISVEMSETLLRLWVEQVLRKWKLGWGFKGNLNVCNFDSGFNYQLEIPTAGSHVDEYGVNVLTWVLTTMRSRVGYPYSRRPYSSSLTL